MNKRQVRQVLTGFAISLVLSVRAEVLIGNVIGVSVGGTVTLIDANKTKHKVRLMGIDAPEKSQSFGSKAKQTISNYIYKKEVTV